MPNTKFDFYLEFSLTIDLDEFHAQIVKSLVRLIRFKISGTDLYPYTVSKSTCD